MVARTVYKSLGHLSRLLPFALCPWIFPHSTQTKPDCARNSACSGSDHCSLSTSWLYSPHLSYKRNNMNRALNMCWGYSVFVRLLFFQVREKPRVRLTDSNCTDIFVSRHSPHELELKLEGQGDTNIGVGMFWGATMCICFGLIYPISATVSRRKFVLSEPTVFVAVKGASCKQSFRKAKFPEKKSWGLCKYHHNAGVLQGFQNCEDSHNCCIFLDSCSKVP